MTNWPQLGEDFRQKYEGTFCRYRSKTSPKQEVFTVMGVQPQAKEGPHITLYNGRVGDLLLKYTTEAELDFSFPRCRVFQFEKRAVWFSRKFQRQWKKGICEQTASVIFPYGTIIGGDRLQLTEALVSAVFEEAAPKSISSAIEMLKDDYLSVALNDTLSLGLSEVSNKYWLWFDAAPIGEVTNSIKIRVPQFEQEVRDFIRDTRDYARPIV